MSRVDTDPHDAVEAAKHAVLAMEEEADIAEEAELARDVFRYDISSETPFGSEASKQESRDARRWEHEAMARRTRILYFSLPDQDLRRRLIAVNRKVDTERHKAAWIAVTNARAALNTAVRNGGTNPAAKISGAGIAAASVWTVFTWAGIGAALALIAGMAAYLPGAAVNLIARRDAAIRTAEQVLAQAKETAEEAYVLAAVFTAREERTGKADTP